MPFVKLDCGILDSTLWFERDAREVFLTALLMAEPREFTTPTPQLEIRTLAPTGWTVPPGWYGFTSAAGAGIIYRAQVAAEAGLTALELLGSPELSSRSSDFDGRRLARVDGGFVVLNYMKYRERDYTSAERSRRYREKKVKTAKTSRRGVTQSPRDITQAEAEAYTEQDQEQSSRTPTVHPSGEEKSSDSQPIGVDVPTGAIGLSNDLRVILPGIPGHSHSIGNDGELLCGCEYPPNAKALTRLAREIVKTPTADPPSAVLKDRAAAHGLPYDADSVRKALDSAEVQIARQNPADAALWLGKNILRSAPGLTLTKEQFNKLALERSLEEWPGDQHAKWRSEIVSDILWQPEWTRLDREGRVSPVLEGKPGKEKIVGYQWKTEGK